MLQNSKVTNKKLESNKREDMWKGTPYLSGWRVLPF